MATDPQPGNTARADSFPANSDSAIHTAWLLHISKLDKAKKDRFQSFQKSSYEEYLAAITDACTQQRSSSTSLRIASWFKPMFDAVEMYMPHAVAISQAYPNPSSIILGSISCVMQTSGRFVQFQDNIAQHLSRMGRKVQVFQQYDDQAYQNSKVKLSLVGVLGAILDFCSEAQSLVINAKGNVRGGLKIWSLSLFVSFESKFQRPLSDFDNNLEDLKENAAIAAHKRIEQHYQAHEKSSAKQRQDAQNVEGYLSRIDYHQSLANVYQERLDRQRERKDKEKKKLQILQWFPSTDFPKTYEAYCKRHHEGTGQWFYEREEYTEWKDGTSSDLLWCKGNSGCGKSVLAALAITDLKISQQPKTALAYVYCDHMDPSARDAFTLGSTLLKQLIREDPGLNQSVESLYDRNVGLRASGPVWADMEQATLSIVHSFQTAYIVVDGLDELHDTQQKDLARLLCALTESTACVKVLIFSRPDRRELETVLSQFTILRTDTGENDFDIEDFITSNVTQESIAVGSDIELLAEMQLKLTTQAGGSFLWANETIQNLKTKTRPREVAEALESLPIGMEKHYEASLLRVLEETKERRELALDVLFWAVNVQRPLSKDEMLEAISVTPGMTSLSERDKVSFSGNISSWCGHLVILDYENTFILRHTSVSDYLKKTAEEKRPDLKEYWSRQMNAAAIISRICLTYLMFDAFACGSVSSLSDLERKQREYPLLSYAATRWASHWKDATSPDDKLAYDLVMSSQDRRDFILQIALEKSKTEEVFPKPQGTSPLHICALFGLDRLADRLPNVEQYIDTANSERRYPLDYALDAKSLKMTFWLLKKNRDYRQITGAIALLTSPMHVAADCGWSEVVDILIREDYRVDVIAGTDDCTPLQYAADAGHIEIVRLLLDAGADVNRLDWSGQTALMHAAGTKNAELIRLIIRAGADINATSFSGDSALYLAAVRSDLDALTILLEHGAITETLFEDYSFEEALQEAVKTDFAPAVVALINGGAKVDSQNRQGLTALHIAATMGSISTTQILVQAGADIKITCKRGMTALHTACEAGRLKITKILFEQAEAPAILETKDSSGLSPLHHAACNGNLGLVKYLVDKGASVDSTDSYGDTSLLMAVSNGHKEVVEFLLSRKASIDVKGFINSTALHAAADNDQAGLVPLLVSEGIDINAIDDEGHTAIHLAAENGHYDVVKAFIQSSPSLDLNRRNIQGKTALHRAAKYGHLEVARLLLEHRAEMFPDNYNQLPIHHAAWAGHEAVTKLLMSDENINLGGFRGRTALYEAAAGGFLHLVELLLDNGADPNLVDDDSDPPVIESCRSRHTTVVNLLLDRGADAFLTDRFDTTLMHCACRIGDQPLVERLMSLGCDGLVRDQFGETPFIETLKSGNVELASFLVEHGLSPLDTLTVYGDTCFHVVTEMGNVYMLNRLLELDSTGLTRTDGFKRSLLHIAAQKGHTKLASALIDLGLSPEALSIIQETPFYNAVESRSPSMVGTFLSREEAFDLNVTSVLMNNTPMVLAASTQCPKIVKKLLQAGADPSLRNWFGMNAMDYALLHDPTKEVFDELKIAIEPTPWSVRRYALYNTIVDTTQILSGQSASWTSALDLFKRFYGTLVLGRALLMLSVAEDADKTKDALPFLFEQVFPPDKSLIEWRYRCSLCGWDIDEEDGYCDITCFNSALCVACYKVKMKSDEEKGAPLNVYPLAADILQDLEASVQPVRAAVQDIPKENLADMVDAIEYFDWMSEWLSDKIEDYERWERTYNSSSAYSKSIKPGSSFIKILEKVKKLLPKLEDDAIDTEDAEEDIREQAVQELKTHEDAFYALQREQVPDLECQSYQCADHKYLFLGIGKRNEMCKQGDALNEKGQVTDEFLHYIHEKYKREQELSQQNEEKNSSSDPAIVLDPQNRPLNSNLLRLNAGEPPDDAQEGPTAYLASTPQEALFLEPSESLGQGSRASSAQQESLEDTANSEESSEQPPEAYSRLDTCPSETSTDDFSNIDFAQAFGINTNYFGDDSNTDGDSSAARDTKLLRLALKLGDAVQPGFSDDYRANESKYGINPARRQIVEQVPKPAPDFMNDRTSRTQAQGYLTGLVEKALWVPRRMIWGSNDESSGQRSRQTSPEISKVASSGSSREGGQKQGGEERRSDGEGRLLHEHFWAI